MSYTNVLCDCSRMSVADFDYGEKCEEIAEKTDGLSGREISKLGVAWQVVITSGHSVHTCSLYLMIKQSRVIL